MSEKEHHRGGIRSLFSGFYCLVQDLVAAVLKDDLTLRIT
jgi:hypothetical protein